MKFMKAEDVFFKVNHTVHHPIVVFTPDNKKHYIVASAHGDNNEMRFVLDNGEIYGYEDLLCYDPMYDGAVTAIRIYLKDGYQPMADLAFAFEGMITIEWDRCDLRDMFMPGINAYTLMYDTRCARPFTDWVKTKEDTNEPA